MQAAQACKTDNEENKNKDSIPKSTKTNCNADSMLVKIGNDNHSLKTLKQTIKLEEPLEQMKPNTSGPRRKVTNFSGITDHNQGFSEKDSYKNSSVMFIDSDEYVGSNVQKISVTTSVIPQASPSKSHNATESTQKTTDINKFIDPTQYAQNFNSNSTSNSNSNSNSCTSSVIATPIQIRNGNSPHIEDLNHEDIAREIHNGCKLLERNIECNDIFTTNILPLGPPTKFITSSVSFNAQYGVMNLSIPLTPSWSSSTSSASIATNMSSSTTSSPKVTPISKKLTTMEPQLLHWKDMPKYLQFNPYVLEGYRPLQTFKGCLLSLFYWHNETINILTHAIPILYILAIVPGLMPWEKEYRFLSFCHVFGSVAPWCGSFIYHLFMNIDKGENVYHRLLKLDMVGIWVSQSFGALPLVTATAFCFSYKWKWSIIISYCMLSLWGLYKALTAGSPWQRRLCFTLPFTMRSILTFLRTFGWVGGNRVALSHVYLQDGVSILGGAIGAMRIPEKWFPGLVDFYLNSHNIMHVLVVVAVYSMHKATVKDFEWMSGTNCDANITNATGEELERDLSSNIEL